LKSQTLGYITSKEHGIQGNFYIIPIKNSKGFIFAMKMGILMSEPVTSSEKLRRLNIAHDLFDGLIKDDDGYPPEVKLQLKKDLVDYESKIKDLTSSKAKKTTASKVYDIWTNSGNSEASEEKIKEYKKSKTLFVDADRGIVYKKYSQLNEFKKRKQSFKILECILKNKGKATPGQILKVVDEKSGLEKESKIQKRIATPVSRLRSILETVEIELSHLEIRSFCLDESVDFILVQEKF